MKKQFLFFFLFILVLGKNGYARDTAAVKPAPAFTDYRDVPHLLSAASFVPSVAEVHTARLDASSHIQVVKKTAGTPVGFYNIQAVAVNFLHRESLPRFTNSATSYLDFIFPFYCFW